MNTSLRCLLLALAAAAASPATALDGKWTPAQIGEIDAAELRRLGLELPPSRLWDAERGTGLLAGTVLIGGCSGGFVSKHGLIVTNHHCLFPLVQEHSTPARNLIRDGYLARTRAEELPSATLRVEVPKRFTDVTARLLAAVPEGATPAQRLDAIDAARRALVDECSTQPDTRCKVAVFDEGVNYVLIETRELRDVRLVYAPPRMVGEYGGEIDNWSWPRHTGDIALARVYVGKDGRPADRADDNVPHNPEFHFPIAREGVMAGDFVMVLGYPGITWRALLAEEMRERRERFFVRREEVFGEWIAHLEAASKDDAAGAIAVAANLKGIANRYKNAQGQIAGLDRGRIIERQAAEDAAVLAFAEKTPAHRAAIVARTALLAVLAEREADWERGFLLNLVPLGVEAQPGGIPPLPKALYFGATLAQWAHERAKPAAARADSWLDADLPRLRARLRAEQGSLFLPAEQRVLAALVRRALALPAEQRIAAIDTRFAGLDAAGIEKKVAELYASTTLLDPERREALLAMDSATLAQQDDALLQLGVAWAADRRALRDRERDWLARSALHRPIWRRALAAQAGKPVAPDANSTLRVSLATVQGYAPRDGMVYTPFTRLGGALEKHTGVEPFDLPARVREAAAQPGERWRSVDLGDIPLNFLADGDTSGGNSGSPVVNGRGELVGVNFDRVWENVAGDFGFRPEVSRNISVDVRFLLWLLDRVENADALLAELGVERGKD
jgi:hypothetical protein